MSTKAAKRAAGRHTPETSGGAGSAGSERTKSLFGAVAAEPIAIMTALLLLARPVIDGLTYPPFNLVFTVWTALIFVTWAVDQLRHGAPIRNGIAVGLLGLFLAIAALTGLNTIQAEGTLLALSVWAGYLMLFTAVTNGIRTPLGRSIVLGAFICILTLEALYSLYQLYWGLPELRMAVHAGAAARQTMLNTVGDLSAEFEHRLETNRASGTLLFANALGAFMILGLPYTILSIIPARMELKSVLAKKEWISGARAKEALVLQSALAGFVTLVVSFLVLAVPFSIFFAPLGSASSISNVLKSNTLMTICIAAVIPVSLAVLVIVLVRTRGLRGGLYTLRVFGLPLAALIQVSSLYVSFSRGAVIGIAAAGAFIFLLLRKDLLSKPMRPNAAGFARQWTIWVLCAALFASLTASLALAQPRGSEASPKQANNAAVPGFEIPPGQSPTSTLTKEKLAEIAAGRDLTFKDLVNPASLRLRVDYWVTGWRMALANLATGVGFGNFGPAYAMYQHVGASPVKQAHNDYLQVLCETGIFGFAAFVAFWCYWARSAVRSIVAEQDKALRIRIAGLSCGVFAFLIHSLVDFNFYNPSLATFAFFLAGMVLVLRDPIRAEAPKRASLQIVMVPLICVATLIAGYSARGFWSNRLVKDKTDAPGIVNAISWISDNSDPATYDKTKLSYVPLALLIELFPENEIRQFCGIGMLSPAADGKGTVFRPLAPDQSLMTNDVLNRAMIYVKDMKLAWEFANKRLDPWIVIYERADYIFPYDVDLALYLFQFYQLKRELALNANEANDVKIATLKCEEWAKECVERSPYNFTSRHFYGKALWFRAQIEQSSAQARVELYLRGLEEYRMETVLYPTLPVAWRHYAEALREMARAYREKGDEASKAKYAALGKAARDTAKRLEAEIQQIESQRHIQGLL
jgi:hypothetical protein